MAGRVRAAAPKVKQKLVASHAASKKAVASLPVKKVKSPVQGFLVFVREQGVVGLAIGLVLGVAAKSVVDSLVANIFNPVIGLIGNGGDLSDKYVCLKTVGGKPCYANSKQPN